MSNLNPPPPPILVQKGVPLPELGLEYNAQYMPLLIINKATLNVSVCLSKLRHLQCNAHKPADSGSHREQATYSALCLPTDRAPLAARRIKLPALLSDHA